MTALPLVTRELQAESRRSFNYWLRVLGAGFVVVAFTLTSIQLQVAPSQFGPLLFRALNSALALAIWILVPALTADCLSREKREGTLGLLFLTPLTARDIVLGKMLTHGLRAATIVLAALPLLALPLILGGVGWKWAVQSLVSHLEALLLALTAGLIASVRTTEWTRALVMAEVLSGLLAFVFGAAAFVLSALGRFGLWNLFWSIVLFLLVRQLVPNKVSEPFQAGWVNRLSSWQVLLEPDAARVFLRNHIPWLVSVGVASLGYLACVLADSLGLGWTGFGKLMMAGAVLVIAVDWSARHLKENWQRELAEPPQPAWVKIFSSSDFWQTFFRWDKSRTLDRNPIAWLQEYSWTARLTKWGWCGLILLGQFYALLPGDFISNEIRLNLLLLLGLAFSASGSFRRERQMGALELLLVTPLQPRHLIGGRVWGIWCHFLPGMAILYSCWLMAPYAQNPMSRTWLCFGLSSYVLLPVVGLYFSLWRTNFLVAWLATCGVALMLPWLAMLFLGRFFDPLAGAAGVAALCGLQGLAAFLTAHQLFQDLSRRAFAWQYATT